MIRALFKIMGTFYAQDQRYFLNSVKNFINRGFEIWRLFNISSAFRQPLFFDFSRADFRRSRPYFSRLLILRISSFVDQDKRFPLELSKKSIKHFLDKGTRQHNPFKNSRRHLLKHSPTTTPNSFYYSLYQTL